MIMKKECVNCPGAVDHSTEECPIRATFETYMLGREHPVFGWLNSNWFGRDDNPATYENDYVQGCWVMWQARSLPVGVPGEWLIETGFYVVDRPFRFVDSKSHTPTIKVVLPACEHDDSASWGLRDQVAANISAMLAAPTVKESLSVASEPDSGWVEPVALTSCSPDYDAGWRDGISEAKRLNAPTVKAEQVQCVTPPGNACPGDGVGACKACPSLPAAGSAVESWDDQVAREFPNSEPEYWPDSIAIPAMGREIRAALSARQCAPDPERVSVPVEQLKMAAEILLDPRAYGVGLARIHGKKLHALLASHGRGEA